MKIKNQLILTFFSIFLCLIGLETVSAQIIDDNDIGDIIIVSKENESFIYITIPKKKSIYRHKLTAQSPSKEINIEREFTRVDFNHNFRKPTALAYQNGKLLVCDVKTVFEADITTLEVKPLVEDLDEPEAIAVSDEGRVAVHDDSKGKVFLYEEIYDPENVRQIKKIATYDYDEVDRMLFIANDLLILDSKKERISLNEDPLWTIKLQTENRNKYLMDLNSLLAKVNETDSIQDFTVRNGVYYLSNKTTISAFVPNSSQKSENHQILNPRPVRFSSSPRSRITSTRDELLVKEQGNKNILRVPRPVPVRINFEIPDESDKLPNARQPLENIIIQQRKALADLYNYLWDKSLLEPEDYKVTNEYSNARAFLRDEKIRNKLLLERPDLTRDEIRNKSYLDPLTKIFCQLNKSLCIKDAPSKMPLKINQILRLPKVPIETDFIYLSTFLNGKSVKEHITERVILDQQSLFPAEQLLRINKSYIRTTESEILYIKNSPGDLLLPATIWKLNVFVNGADYYTKDSELRTLLKYPGIIIDDEQKFDSKSFNTSVPTAPAYQDETEKIRESRKLLLTNIDYNSSSPLELTNEEIYIGIAENLSNLRPHIDLNDVWHVKGDNNATVKPMVFENPGDPGRNDTPSKSLIYHANHVGGIIASRSPIVPGLLPGAKLFFINNESADSTAKLRDGIRDAIGANVKIFNFSFTRGPETTDGSNEQLFTQIGISKSGLFITAAGNDGKDLGSSATIPAPIKLSNQMDNVLGVGAIDNDKNIFTHWQCNPNAPNVDDRKCPGSNYGKTYVQILAPGLNIYSTSFENKNAIATGTSQSTPMVASAAGMIYLKVSQSLDRPPGSNTPTNLPLNVKARLIYTTDWTKDYANKVWGGSLNFGRAINHPTKNLLVYTNRDRVFSFIPKTAGIKISNLNPEIDDPSCFLDLPVGRGKCPAEPIPFSNILRIQLLDVEKKLFSVFYLEQAENNQQQLRILRNVQFQALNIPCKSLSELNKETNEFQLSINSCQEYPMGIVLTDIYDYTAATPVGYISFR